MHTLFGDAYNPDTSIHNPECLCRQVLAAAAARPGPPGGSGQTARLPEPPAGPAGEIPVRYPVCLFLPGGRGTSIATRP